MMMFVATTSTSTSTSIAAFRLLSLCRRSYCTSKIQRNTYNVLRDYQRVCIDDVMSWFNEARKIEQPMNWIASSSPTTASTAMDDDVNDNDGDYSDDTLPLPGPPSGTGGFVCMPTGTGKTMVISHVIHSIMKKFPPDNEHQQQPTRSAGNILVLAHRSALIEQLSNSLNGIGVEHSLIAANFDKEQPTIDMKEGKRYDDDDDAYDDDADVEMVNDDDIPAVQVASIQTLLRRVRLYDRSRYSLIITDEAHHASSSSYTSIMEYFSSAARIGFSATPYRTMSSSESVKLFHLFGSDFIYQLSMADAIAGGWLVGLNAVGIRFSSFDTNGKTNIKSDNSDSDNDQLKESPLQPNVLENTVHVDTIALSALRHKHSEGPTLIFAAGIGHANAVHTSLIRRGAKAEVLTSQLPYGDRESLMKRFLRDEIDFLINVDILTEGFDAPNIRCVLLARKTSSRGLNQQMIGRCLRPLPNVIDGLSTAAERRAAIRNSNKKNGLVVDLVGNIFTHGAVEREHDAVGGEFVQGINENIADSIEGYESENQMISRKNPTTKTVQTVKEFLVNQDSLGSTDGLEYHEYSIDVGVLGVRLQRSLILKSPKIPQERVATPSVYIDEDSIPASAISATSDEENEKNRVLDDVAMQSYLSRNAPGHLVLNVKRATTKQIDFLVSLKCISSSDDPVVETLIKNEASNMISIALKKGVIIGDNKSEAYAPQWLHLTGQPPTKAQVNLLIKLKVLSGQNDELLNTLTKKEASAKIAEALSKKKSKVIKNML